MDGNNRTHDAGLTALYEANRYRWIGIVRGVGITNDAEAVMHDAMIPLLRACRAGRLDTGDMNPVAYCDKAVRNMAATKLRSDLRDSPVADAGWFSDPGDSQSRERYWDGTGWTDRVRASGAESVDTTTNVPAGRLPRSHLHSVEDLAERYGNVAETPAGDADPSEIVVDQAMGIAARSSLEQLKPTHRAALERLANGASHAEIAAELVCSVDAVRGYTWRARSACREVLRGWA